MICNYFKAVSVVLLFIAACPARSEEVAVDLGKFVQELQRMDASGDKIRLVWWIPTAYWQESFHHAAMTQQQKDAFITSVDDYIIVAVADGTLSAVGNSQWCDSNAIRKDLSLQLSSGESLTPLSDDEISPGTRALLKTMKPLFGKMLGDFGTGLEVRLLPRQR